MNFPRLAALTCFSALSLAAHECWLQPSNFTPAPGEEVRLTLNVGMQFQGETRDFTPARVARLRHFSATGETDWTARAQGQRELPVSFPSAGSHVVTLDSSASLLTLDADKFHAYLREEGLDPIITLREQAGEASSPGRERYQRCNKTLVLVGGRSDTTWKIRTGQRLELVPLDNPASLAPGESLRCLLLFNGTPLPGALLRAWHRAGEQLTVIDARTAADGTATFTLPLAGRWMLSTVHMIRTTADKDADWESFWGNLTFSLAPTPASHPVRGVIVSLLPDQSALLVKHEEVPGVMRAMTMLFKVEPAALTRFKTGDAIRALMSRRPDGWWLHAIETGTPAK
jgi:uncharacterized GH25 family protein